MKTATIQGTTVAAPRHGFVSDLAELVKARLTLLVLLTTAVGFYLGSESPIDYRALFHTVFGTAAAAAGAAALNQWWERRADALMNRTKSRPLPAGRMSPVRALALGAALSFFGVVYLAIVCNGLSAALTAITIVIYIFAYTPLKRTSTANTAVGAIPGAIPPMIGWAAARGHIGVGAWSLFVIVFLWQMPHFFAIAWIFTEDYARGGFVMHSSGVNTGRQIILYCCALIPVSLLPTLFGATGITYLYGALLLGFIYLGYGSAVAMFRSNTHAHRLLRISVLYLPALLVLMMFDKV